MVTGKEAIWEALRLKEPPRLPVGILSGGVWRAAAAGYTLEELLKERSLMVEVLIETNRRIDSDLLCVASGYQNYPIAALGGKLKFRARGAPDVQEPLVRSERDLAALSLAKFRADPGIQALWEVAAQVERLAGQEFAVAVHGWGPFTLAGQLCGVERLMAGLLREQNFVKKVLAFTTELAAAFFLPAVARGVSLISLSEPTSSGDLISRCHFIEYVLPVIREVTRRIRVAGAEVLLHICGDISDRLDLIAQSGVAGLSVDYKVDLGLARVETRNCICLAGNVNPVAVMEQGTPEMVLAEARKCIELAAAGGGYILMPGCDLPPGVPLANIKALVAAARTCHSPVADTPGNQ